MPYEFSEDEYAPEPQSSGSRIGGPPHKWTGAGVLDPPVPPKRPPGPIPSIPSSLLIRIFAGVLLLGLAAATLFLLFARH